MSDMEKKEDEGCCSKEGSCGCGSAAKKCCCGGKIIAALVLLLVGGAVGYLMGTHCKGMGKYPSCPMPITTPAAVK